jgi:periplasmic protein TonB
MPAFGSQPLITRPELVRWGLCAAVVIAAHGLVALALAARSEEAELAPGAPVVTVELAPQAMAPPAPPRDLAPGPLMESESQEPASEEAQPKREEPEKEQVVEETPTPDPDVSMPPPNLKPEEKPAEDKPVTQPVEAAPMPTAPQAAPAPAARVAAPAVGQTVARPTRAAIASWERLLIAQLERHKRYPAQARGKVGEAQLEFTIDRTGNVLTSRVVHSSGSEALDAAALALVKNAAPLPIPPAGLPKDLLSVILPIRYH